jgi:twitching motility protein PilI
MADSSSRLRSLSSSPSAASSRDGSRSTGRGTSAQAAAAKMASANRRDRLREFQTGLADKLRRAQNTPLAVNRLGIQIGAQRLLIDLADAGEILAVPDIMPVPLTKPWYRGLANVRGNLIGIVDLSLFAGGPATPIDKESRVLAFSTELRFSTGILVSRMLGLRSAADLSTVESDRTAVHPASTSASSEPNFDVFSPWVRARLLDAQDVHWQELDLAALTADPRFVDIAR